MLFVLLTLSFLDSACEVRYVHRPRLQSDLTCLDADTGKSGQTHQNASLKSRCLMRVGHLLCHLQLQAVLGSWRESFASRGSQQTTPPSSPQVVGVGHGRDRRGGQVQHFLAREGRGTTGLRGPRRGWDRSLAAGKELEKPVAGSGRASSRRSPFPSASAVPAAAPGAAFSPLFGDMEDRLGKGKPLCCGGKRCSPCGRETSHPWGETKAFACP